MAGWLKLRLLATPLLLLAACSADKKAVFQDADGFRLTPPPGWVERARGDALSGPLVHKQANLPLPPLGAAGKSSQERLVVRYDRVTSGSLAWLRVSALELPGTTAL